MPGFDVLYSTLCLENTLPATPDVSFWNAIVNYSQFMNFIYSLFADVSGGLTKDDISKLNQAQIEAIRIEAIRKIPPIQFSVSL